MLMKIIVIFAIAAAVLGAYAVSLRHSMVQSTVTADENKQESPFFCNRKAIPPDQMARKEVLNLKLLSLRRNTRELPDGYEFELPSDPATIQAVAEWAALEKLCCPFFDIDLRLEHERGPFLLRLTGREGVKQFIHAEFGPLFRGAL
jgi:hypothetical protein